MRGLTTLVLTLLGLAFLVLALVVWDQMLSRFSYQGGFTEGVFFFVVLVAGGFVLLFGAAWHWRRRP
jgi:polyferredoxin